MSDSTQNQEGQHGCPECGYPIFDDDDEFVSGGGFAVSHSVDDGVWIEEHSCPNCGEVLNVNYTHPDDPVIR